MTETPQTTIIVQPAPIRRVLVWLLSASLAASVVMNLGQYAAYRDYTTTGTPVIERFHSGNLAAKQKIAVLSITGTIMPPFTDHTLETIQQIQDDENVIGVVLEIDSPGGLVADSHRIYHALNQLREEREIPIYVSMGRMAASGGYYVAMGAGPEGEIYAEETTWTGSIGVIIPRYNVSQLADEFGVRAEPLTTGPFKDSLSPFRELTDEERVLWDEILDDAFVRFRTVIDDGRDNLDADAVEALATGQVFTAQAALDNGLIDKIGYLDDAIDDLATKLEVGDNVRVVKYDTPVTLASVLLGQSKSHSTVDPLAKLLDSSVPRAMYFCGWHAGLTEP